MDFAELSKVDFSTLTPNYCHRPDTVMARCTWKFEDGSEEGLKERMVGCGQTEEKALEALKKKIAEKQARLYFGTAIDLGLCTVDEALEEILKAQDNGSYISRKTGKRKTVTACERDRKTAESTLFPYKVLMKKRVCDVKRIDVQKWADWLDALTYTRGGEKRRYSAVQKNDSYNLLDKVFAPYSRRLGSLDVMKTVEKWVVHHKKVTEDDILTPKEISLFLGYCAENLSDANRLRGALQILTYVRAGELLGLKVKDYNPEEHTLRINRKLIKHLGGQLELSEEGYGKSDSSLRTIVLCQQAEAIVSRLCEGKKPEDMLFITEKGNYVSIDNYRHWIKRTLKRLGIKKDLGTHSLRKSGISLVVNGGADLAAVSACAGHSETSVTERYYTAAYRESSAKAARVEDAIIEQIMTRPGTAIEEKGEEDDEQS